MKSRLVLLTAMACLSAPAMGQTFEPGFYAGAGIGQARIEEDVFGLEANDTAWQVFAGYNFIPYLSAEVGYLDGGSPEDSIGTIAVTAETTGFQFSALPTLPISDTFSIFMRLAYFAWDQTATAVGPGGRVSLEDDGNEFAWGAGLLWTNEVAGFRVEYEQADVEDTTYSAIMASLLFSF